MTREIRLYRPGEESYVADLHRRLYEEEYDWGPAFVDYAVQIALDFAKKPVSDRAALWIATLDGVPKGSIMLCETEDPAVGQLRLFAVDKTARRLGIGRALMEELLAKAREAGYREIVLWTAEPLTAAIRQYERFGFRTVETAENHAWRKDGGIVTEVKMVLSLKEE